MYLANISPWNESTKHPLNIKSPPTLVIVGSVPVGVIIGIFLFVELGAIAKVVPDVTPPRIAQTPSLSTNLLNAEAATVLSLWSSSKMNSTFLPFIPPAALISSAKRSAPSLTDIP